MSDGTRVVVQVKPVSWGCYIDGTLIREVFFTKEEAVKFANEFAKDMRESEGTKATVRVARV